MAKKSTNITEFFGGIGEYEKFGTNTASFRFAKNMDIHQDPTYITPHLAPTKVSGSTVTDLVKWAVDGTPYDTNRYFYGDGGNLYKETSGGTWSVDRSGGTIGNSAAGQGLAVYDDYLYYTTSTTLGRKGKLSGTPTFDDDFLSDGTTNVDQSLSASGQTYTLQTSIDEGATHRQTFTPQKDPIKSITINVDTVGTGDWTVTVHDSNNVEIGAKTIANSSVSTGDVVFTFDTALRVTIGNEYHFHVTVSTGTSKITTSTASDHETADFTEKFGILIADSNWHPIQEHLNNLVIGNDNYLAQWDRAIYEPNKIQLGPGYKVRALTKHEEYIVAACWKGNDSDDVEQARLYYWDGISTTFNFFRDVPMGLPNAVHLNSKGALMGVYGRKGGMYLGNGPFQKIQEPPKLTRSKKLEVYPGAITEWQEKTYIGYAGDTDDGSTFEQGVYEFGSRDNGLPNVLNYAFTTSEGTTQDTDVKIGMVQGFGKDLYIGSADSDGSSYRVDKISLGDSVATSGSYEQFIIDNGAPQHDKLANRLVVTFLSLSSGDTITPKYKVDRAGSWTTSSNPANSSGDTRAYLDIDQRYKEIEVGFDWTTNNSTGPKITGVYLEYDDLKEERRDD